MVIKKYTLDRHKVNTSIKPPFHKAGFPQPELSTGGSPQETRKVSPVAGRSPVGRSSLGCGKVRSVNLDTALTLIGLGIEQESAQVEASPERKAANDPASTLLDYSLIRSERKGLYKYSRVISGKVIEDYSYQKTQGQSKQGNMKGRQIKDHNNISLVQALIRSGNLAKKEIRRIVNSNVSQWGSASPKFFTITFADNIQDQKAANYEFTKFIQRLNWQIFKTKKVLLKYLVVLQYQDRGAIHWHVIFFNLPLIPVNQEYQKRWSSWCEYNFNLSDLWGQGFVKINRIDNVDNVGAYVASYVGNEKDSEHRGSGGRFVDPRYFNQKRYFCSKGLFKPEIIKSLSPLPEMDQEPVFQSQFENEHTGIVEYKQYNPRRKKVRKSVDKQNTEMIERKEHETRTNENETQYLGRCGCLERSSSSLERNGS